MKGMTQGFVFIVAFSCAAAAAANDSFSSLQSNQRAQANETVDLAEQYLDEVFEKQARVSASLAPLKSSADVSEYLATTSERRSPFIVLSPSEQKMFVRSLEFNENGLTTFDHTILARLYPSEAYRILSLFGMQSGAGKVSNGKIRSDLDAALIGGQFPVIGDFLEGYRCESRATCGESFRSACTSNC